MRDEQDDRLTDGALAAIDNGDIAGVADLYDLLGRCVHGYALVLTGRAADAETVTVATFTYIWRNSASRPARGTSSTLWVLGVTKACGSEHVAASVSASKSAVLPTAVSDSSRTGTKLISRNLSS